VIEGAIEFHSEFYEPVKLQTGESVYFDATMGHALISIGPKPARVVSAISRPGTQPPLQLVKK
jgi:hypothetical protein